MVRFNNLTDLANAFNFSPEDKEYLDSLDGKKDGKTPESVMNIFNKRIYDDINKGVSTNNQAYYNKISNEMLETIEKKYSYCELSEEAVGNFNNSEQAPLSNSLLIIGEDNDLIENIKSNNDFKDNIMRDYGVNRITHIPNSDKFKVSYNNNGKDNYFIIESKSLEDFKEKLIKLQQTENEHVIAESKYNNGKNIPGVNYTGLDDLMANFDENTQKPNTGTSITMDNFKRCKYTNTSGETQTIMGIKIKSGETVNLYITKASREQVGKFFKNCGEHHPLIEGGKTRQIVICANDNADNDNIQEYNSNYTYEHMLPEINVTAESNDVFKNYELYLDGYRGS